MREKIITFSILGALVIGAGLVVGNISKGANALKAVEQEAQDMKSVQVRVGDKTFLAELAVTVEEQAEGLSGREKLAEDTGMIFVFDPAEKPTFWMRDMRFNLDIIWIYHGRVVDISRNLPAPMSGTEPDDLPRYAPKSIVDYVLEVNAGAADSIKIGDIVEVIDAQRA